MTPLPSNAAEDSTSPPSETTLQSLNDELIQVERRLDAGGVSQRRLRHGRAGYNSMADQLGSIRQRLSLHQGGDNTRLSERLDRAQMAHSFRIPLGLLSGSNQEELQRRRSSIRASTVLSSSVRSSRAKSDEPAVLPAAAQDDSPSRRSSLLVASRRVLTDHHDGGGEGFEVELLHHGGGATLLTPAKEVDEDNMSLSSAASSEPETPVLLTKRQSNMFRSSSSGMLIDLMGLPSSANLLPGSVVYSWGSSGIQSLHDDVQDKAIHQAKVDSESRIGRPGAASLLSVSTSATHTACATVQGEVLICGKNVHGAVDPTQRDVEIIQRPTLLEALQTRIVQVGCGLDHTAALTGNGTVLSWGSNQEGQLGHRLPFRSKTTEPNSIPTTFCRPKAMVLMSSGRPCRAASVACGHYFTLVLTTRMSLLACGVGDIAGFSPSSMQEENKKPQLAMPLPILQGLPLVFVSAGRNHAVVLTAHGTAYSWGANKSGCCGRPYPQPLSIPVPMHVPESSLTQEPSPMGDYGPTPFPNWATWKRDDAAVSLADDVAVVHATCGAEHTVLVTRSGRLLVCGSNEHGQLGLPRDNQETSSALVSPVVPLDHPSSGRCFVTAQAGDQHTLLLDDAGDVWLMGSDNTKGPEKVLANQKILTIAAGGNQSIAIAAGRGGAPLGRQFSISSDEDIVEGDVLVQTLEELLEIVEREDKSDDKQPLNPAARELVKRTEELLKYPAVLNGLFMAPSELYQVKEHLISVGNASVRQAVASAIEKGIEKAMDSIRGEDTRMIYPESVRCLLLYLCFFDLEKEHDVVFDTNGRLISAVCETILGLPFEGYNAFLTWATSLYPRELFVGMLVHPLLLQIKRGLRVDVDDNGVEHTQISRRAVPLVVAVLRWLYRASERVGLAKPEDFYSDGVSDVPVEALFQDLYNMKRATKIERSSHFFFCAHPFLFSPSTKRNLLQVESQVEMFKIATHEGVTFDSTTNEFTFDPFWKLEIEREHLLTQTLEAIKNTEPEDLRKKLRVVFKGEEGVDAGGVTKEFFQLLSEELFDVSSGMWSDRFGDQVTWFNSDCSWDEEGFELTGVLCGLALYNSVLLDVHFPIAVYRKLLGLPLGLEDMVDKEVRRGLQQLLDYDGDDVEDIFCLTFEVSWMDLGEERKIELKEGGSDMPVNNDNREEYVLLYVKWLLVDSIQPQWDAFEKGVMRVMDGSSLNLFRPEELELLVVGTPELDFDALESNTEYEGGYDENSAVVKNFWLFIKNADRESQLKFLKFATGSSMAPIGGLGALGFKIQRAGPDSPQLPTSHTCFNTLLIPDYGDDYDKLAERLGRAILECEGFGLQ